MADEQAKQFIEQATQSLQGGQFAQALELANQAVELAPENSEAHLLRAIALSQSNQPQAATDAFRQSISLNPEVAKTYFNFAVHLYSQGQKVEALSMANEAARLEPSHAGARDLILRIESESGLQAPSTPVQSGAPQTYASPQESGVRPGYEAPEHSIKFVENMGGGWLTIAWVLSFIDLAVLAFSMLTVIPLFQKYQGDPTGMQAAMQHAIPVGLTVISWVGKGGMLGWLIVDMLDRRGNWLWVIPQVLCGFCGCGFITLPIYLLAGRKRPQNAA